MICDIFSIISLLTSSSALFRYVGCRREDVWEGGGKGVGKGKREKGKRLCMLKG